MLINFLNNGSIGDFLIRMIYLIPIALIVFPVHELAHAYTAYKMGDPTARNFGRLTLNPVKHIDPFGFFMLIFVGFGWAKPVPINPRYFKNPKKGMAISAIAGPLSNILMAFIGCIIYRAMILIILKNGLFNYYTGSLNPVAESALTFFSYFVTINIYLAVFNLLPVPPLDGSRIVSYFLPYKLNHYYNYVQRYGFIVLILLLNINILTNFLMRMRLSVLAKIIGYLDLGWGLSWISMQIINGINFVLNPIFSLFGG